MTVEAILVVLLVGAIAGWLAGLIMKGAGFGLLGNIIVGIVGAFVAAWLLPQLGIAFSVINPLVTSIVYATIGAVVVLALLSLVRRGAA